jgi:hypothetical protein
VVSSEFCLEDIVLAVLDVLVVIILDKKLYCFNLK